MKKQMLGIITGLFLAASVALTAGAQIVVHIGPPAPHHEERGVAPHEGWVYQPGYNRWDNDHYTWVQGTWVEPPHPHDRWVPGHWLHRGDGWVWVEGHWR